MLTDGRTDEQKAIEDHLRKQNWEQGQIDFMGSDSFDNILIKINLTLSSAPQKQSFSSQVIKSWQVDTNSHKNEYTIHI